MIRYALYVNNKSYPKACLDECLNKLADQVIIMYISLIKIKICHHGNNIKWPTIN